MVACWTVVVVVMWVVQWWVVVDWVDDDLDGWDAVALSENASVVWISVVSLLVGQKVGIF